ncbi:CobW family GTP-binding protein [Anaerocolumna sp. MB42-C2]|uniref:CobW family GTP-binding protein n=1 Tax=Anaerocolumna sp. MB42-C2 TaxID=3070997 RepID=UPI0027DFE4B9|nr:GTP-binding protein [Anaerocolumna sp. MB42-C2]WMJ88028.1 GTP-binding protein [Anaerocolumna sp. MB42-C2]
MKNTVKDKIPVTLITGYLGSGKTTLMNELLKMQSDKKIAIVVNDMGAINIDVTLIKNKSLTRYPDMELINMQNGCICCTLREKFMEQIIELSNKNIDAILVEASGISDPVSIADAFLAYEETQEDTPVYLDSVITVVDADRIYSEFLDELSDRTDLERDDLKTEEEEKDPDIINLIMDQIEFCSLILLNKCDLLTKEQLGEVKEIIKILQPEAKIFETKYSKVEYDDIVSHNPYDYDRIRDSSLINKTLYRSNHKEIRKDGVHEEYGISSFVYTEHRPFIYDKFMNFLENEYPEALIRAKGYIWFADDDIHTQLFEQTGRNASVTEISNWVAALPKEEQEEAFANYPEILEDWDETYGDRMNQIVFIGKDYLKAEIIEKLDQCLGTYMNT